MQCSSILTICMLLPLAALAFPLNLLVKLSRFLISRVHQYFHSFTNFLNTSFRFEGKAIKRLYFFYFTYCLQVIVFTIKQSSISFISVHSSVPPTDSSCTHQPTYGHPFYLPQPSTLLFLLSTSFFIYFLTASFCLISLGNLVFHILLFIFLYLTYFTQSYVVYVALQST